MVVTRLVLAPASCRATCSPSTCSPCCATCSPIDPALRARVAYKHPPPVKTHRTRESRTRLRVP